MTFRDIKSEMLYIR